MVALGGLDVFSYRVCLVRVACGGIIRVGTQVRKEHLAWMFRVVVR